MLGMVSRKVCENGDISDLNVVWTLTELLVNICRSNPLRKRCDMSVVTIAKKTQNCNQQHQEPQCWILGA